MCYTDNNMTAKECGEREETSMQQKSKLIAGILGVTLGAIGIHNFYLGKTNRAIIQIVVTCVTCGLGSIWGIIEGIMIFANVPSMCVDGNNVPLADGPRYQIVAGLLALIAGGLGVHNFYLGRTNTAIAQIVVSCVTCGAGTIWGLVEGVLILMGKNGYDVDANGNPLVKL